MSDPGLMRWTISQDLDPDILEAVRGVIHGPSAVVSKVTRMGFTSSVTALAVADGFKVLMVGPTKKIGTSTVKEAAAESALIIYGHSHCLKLQKTFKRDPFLAELPLTLPSPCPCKEFPECDLTDAWFESAPVRATTNAKLTSMVFVTSREAEYVKEQLRDLDVVVWDESHRISLPAPPRVDLEYSPAPIPWEFDELRDILIKFLQLKGFLHEEGVFDSIEGDLEYAGTSCRLAREYINSDVVPPCRLHVVFGELKKLARHRKKLQYSEDDIRFLRDMCAVMSNHEVTLSFIRSSKGDQWNLVGKHTAEQAAIKEFLKEVCPAAKVFFVSGTQFEGRDGLFEELAGRKLQTVCLPDVKSNNSSMTIYPDRWKLDTINVWSKFDAICQTIRDISASENGASIYLVALNTDLKIALEKALKAELTTVDFDYYRSDRSLGVENPARSGIFVGFPSTPTNSQDFLVNTYEESQELRQLEMLSTAWQAMSRIKDWEGKTPSRAYCIGLTQEQVSQIITQGSNLKAKFIKKGAIEVTVEEALPRPKVMMEPKSKAALNPYLLKLSDIIDAFVPVRDHPNCLKLVKNPRNRIYYNICGNLGFSQNLDSSFKLRFHNPDPDMTPEQLQQNAFALTAIFVTREDKCGLQWHNPDAAGKFGYWIRPLTCTFDELLLQHLNGTETIALPPFDQLDMCYYAAVDFDNHTGLNPQSENVAQFTGYLRHKNIPHLVVQSGTHDGHHVFIPLIPVKTLTAKKFVKQLIRDAGLSDAKDLEAYPKQKSISTTRDGYGNQIKLPLGYNWKAGKRSVFVDSRTLEPVQCVELTHVTKLRELPDDLPVKNKARIPRVGITQAGSAMLPCVQKLLKEKVPLDGAEGDLMRVCVAVEAQHLGMTADQAIELFKDQPDFDPEITAARIADKWHRGYRRFGCEKLQTECSTLVGKYCAECAQAR